MSDKSELEIASKESVALSLAYSISNIENLYSDPQTFRKKLLDLYSECLKTTDGNRNVTDGN